MVSYFVFLKRILSFWYKMGSAADMSWATHMILKHTSQAQLTSPAMKIALLEKTPGVATTGM